MDREYEKKMSGLSEFLEKNKREGQTTEETNRMIYEYLNTDAKMLWEEKTDEEGNTAEDYLGLAEEARSKKQKLEPERHRGRNQQPLLDFKGEFLLK